jgi:hypothetical protein
MTKKNGLALPPRSLIHMKLRIGGKSQPTKSRLQVGKRKEEAKTAAEKREEEFLEILPSIVGKKLNDSS